MLDQPLAEGVLSVSCAHTRSLAYKWSKLTLDESARSCEHITMSLLCADSIGGSIWGFGKRHLDLLLPSHWHLHDVCLLHVFFQHAVCYLVVADDAAAVAGAR